MKYYVSNEIGRFHQAFDSIDEAMELLRSLVSAEIKGVKRDVEMGNCPVGRSCLYGIECEED